MKSYEEFDRNRELFKGMKPDKDIIEHLSRITPKSPNPQEELYKIPSDSNMLLDEKIEVLTALKEGKHISDIPNFYDILELYPKKGTHWD